jgi:hypothetical protein
MKFPGSKKPFRSIVLGVLGRFSIINQSSTDIIGSIGSIDLSDINYSILKERISELDEKLVRCIPAFGSSIFLYEMDGFTYLDVGKGNYIRVNGILIKDEQFVLLQKGVPVQIGGLVLIFKELVE